MSAEILNFQGAKPISGMGSLSHLLKSKEELAKCIYLYFDEINQEPVVYHWTYKLDEISVSETVEAGVKSNDICIS